MTKLVVDGFKAVQINEKQAQARAVPMCQRERLGHTVFQQAAIGQTCERVVVGHAREVITVIALVCAVSKYRQVPQRVTRNIFDRFDRLPFWIDLTTFAPVKKLSRPAPQHG